MLGFELTQHEGFHKPCLRKQTARTDPFSGANGVGLNNQWHIKNHNWAAIMWAEKEVFLYHRIFASNEMVTGQPPGESGLRLL